jgi:hypothetical protein
MMKIKPNGKDRKHDRFKIKGGAIVMLHKPKKINFGKPSLVELGPVVDISWGGLAVHYIDNKNRQIESNELSISFEPNGIVLEGIPFLTVSDTEIAQLPDDKKIRRRSLKFKDLNQKQKARLVNFLQKFTIRA